MIILNKKAAKGLILIIKKWVLNLLFFKGVLNLLKKS